MGVTTGISWTDHTFNTWWGCVKVSPACASCYAERDSKRYGHDVWGPTARRRFFGDKHWAEPYKWNSAAEKAGARRRVFCASMADVFEALPEGHPDAVAMMGARARLFDDVIPRTPWLDWLVLTKRPNVMAAWSQSYPFPSNVVAMTTAEDQEWFDKRVGHLLFTRAHRRGLSLEPLLGPIDLQPWLSLQSCGACLRTQPEQDLAACVHCGSTSLRQAISWVITGGESGPKARPSHPDWFRSLRDQCVAAGVPFHFKQWGEYGPAYSDDVLSPHGLQIGIGDDPDGGRTLMALTDGTITDADWNGGPGPHLKDAQPMVRVGKKRAGRLLDGVTWDQFPAEVTRG